MTQKQTTGGGDDFVRRFQYDDGVVIAIDIGRRSADASMDIVDDTVIVVEEDGNQAEYELPDDDAEVFMKNGILTFEIAI